MSFSNYIFTGTSSFFHFLRLPSCSLIKVKFNVCSPPVEVPPVRNKLLLVHSSLCSHRIKPQQISAIFLLNDDTHVGSSVQLILKLRFALSPRISGHKQDPGQSSGSSQAACSLPGISKTGVRGKAEIIRMDAQPPAVDMCCHPQCQHLRPAWGWGVHRVAGAEVWGDVQMPMATGFNPSHLALSCVALTPNHGSPWAGPQLPPLSPASIMCQWALHFNAD